MSEAIKKILLAPFFGLILLIILGKMGFLGLSSLFTPNQTFIFKNIYGFLAFETVILYLLGTFIMYFVFPGPNKFKALLKSFVKSRTKPVTISFGIIAGAIISLISLFAGCLLFNETVSLNLINPMAVATLYPNSLIDILVLGPVIEEFVYRGVLINIITELVKGKRGVALAVILSSLIFGYTHPTEQIIKVAVGLGLSLLYVMPKERNLALPISAHMTSNLVRILFV